MLEENAVTGAEIIESRFAVGCMEETQAGTFSVTGLEPLALATLAGKGFLLHTTEAVLLCSVKHLRQTIRTYVT